MKFHTI